MGARVLIIGAGNVGLKIADGLARSGKVDRLILSGLCQGGGPVSAGVLESCYDCKVKFVEVDGTQQTEVERLLRAEKPDLVMQSASLLSPWAMYGREDPKAKALSATGLGLQLPAQIGLPGRSDCAQHRLQYHHRRCSAGFVGPPARSGCPSVFSARSPGLAGRLPHNDQGWAGPVRYAAGQRFAGGSGFSLNRYLQQHPLPLSDWVLVPFNWRLKMLCQS